MSAWVWRAPRMASWCPVRMRIRRGRQRVTATIRIRRAQTFTDLSEKRELELHSVDRIGRDVRMLARVKGI